MKGRISMEHRRLNIECVDIDYYGTRVSTKRVTSMNDNTGVGGGKLSTGGPGVLCKVCGDRASGKHYGVPSCDGCRGFFKRSIRRNLEYVCKEGGKCVVDVSRRNQCQACRFAKCLQANMRREAVQHERAPRNCTPLTATVNGLSAHGDYYASRASFALPQTNLFFPLPLHITAATASGPFAPLTDPARFLSPYAAQSLAAAAASSTSFDHFTSPTTRTTTPTAFQPTATGLPPGSGLIQVPVPLPAATMMSKSGLSSEGNQVTTATITESMFNSITGDSLALPAPPPIHSISSILSLSSAKENEVSSTGEESPPRSGATTQQYQHQLLFSPVGTVGPVHGGKSETDMLLESAAKLLFLAVKWAKTVPSFLQLPANDQKLLLEEAWAELFVITAAQWGLPIDNEFIVRNPQAVKLQSAIQQFGIARVDYREAACLKALVLFRPDQPRLYAAHEVLLLQDQTVALLHEKCGGVRLGHLLLLLPAIKAAANAKVLQEMLFRKTVGEVAIERLLLDLMKT